MSSEVWAGVCSRLIGVPLLAGMLGLAGLPGSAPAQVPPDGALRILALRVSFPPETPDNETTSGNGAFDLRSYEEALPDYRFPFETPPHDRSYFEAQLQALAGYYANVSDGRLTLTFDVFPRDNDTGYLLDRPLIEYGNGRIPDEVNERITRLFRDAVVAANTAESGALDFSAYDAFVVFHAGLGGESSSALNDVPSAFVDLDDLERYAEGAIPVSGGSVRSGILVPEAGSADGRGGLNGLLARFFANQLGLPRLDNPEDGLPAVGDWSLMDTGNITIVSAPRLGFRSLSGNPGDSILVGFIPSRLLAWSRARLGWITPLTVTHDTTVVIQAPGTGLELPEAVRIPLSADEYYLVENRQSRLDRLGEVPGVTLSNGDHGVWTSVSDYDAFIPGSGILVWHVDDAVIRRIGPGRHVNSHPDFREHFDGFASIFRKGISLEEADGLQDIGNASSSRVVSGGIISFSSISGTDRDPFYVGNRTRLGPDTVPATTSNLGYATGIEIEILSPPGDSMSVRVRWLRRPAGWPVEGFSPTSASPRASGGTSAPRVFRSHPTSSAYAADATPLPGLAYVSDLTPARGDLTGDPGDELVGVDDGAPFLVSAGVRVSPGSLPGSPVTADPIVAEFAGAPAVDVWGLSDGRVVWGLFGTVSGEARTGGRPIVALVEADLDGDGRSEILAQSDDGLTIVTEDGAAVRHPGAIGGAYRPAAADLDRDGQEEIVVVHPDGAVSILDDREVLYASRPVAGGATSEPSLADLDGDGFVEVLFGGSGTVWVMRFNAIVQTGGAVRLPVRDLAGDIRNQPLVADLDGDGSQDILVASTTGLLYALDRTGRSLPGFPLSADEPLTGTPLLAPMDEDPGLELVAFTPGGIHLWHLNEVDAALSGTRAVWGQAGGGPGGANRLTAAPLIDPTPASGDLLPATSAYCYPNPVPGARATLRYYLSDAADVSAIVLNPLGEIVDRLVVPPPVALTANEIPWDTSDYASGLYLCRLEAVAGSRREVRFIKVAIVK